MTASTGRRKSRTRGTNHQTAAPVTTAIAPAATRYGSGPTASPRSEHDDAEDRGERQRIEHALRDDAPEDGAPRAAEEDDAHQVAGARRQRIVPHVADESQPVARAPRPPDPRVRRGCEASARRGAPSQRRRCPMAAARLRECLPRRAGCAAGCCFFAHQTITASVASEIPACSSPSRRGRASSTIATTAELKGSRLAVARRVRLERQHAAAPAVVVDDVDRVVSAIRAGDAEEERQPAPEAEPALGRELAAEDERRPDLVEIGAACCSTPFTKTSNGSRDAFWQLDLTPRFHALYDATGVRRTRLATLVTSLAALATAAGGVRG